jgi:hypothetical protein
MTKNLIIGNDDDYLDVEMEEAWRSEHMHVLGATGTGKSRFLLGCIQQDIRNRKGLCLIDPHGELVEHIMDWLGENQSLLGRRKVRYLDPKDPKFSFGFNPLHWNSRDEIDTVANQTANALAIMIGDADITKTPQILLTANLVCIALASARLTLAESTLLTTTEFPEARLKITNQVTNHTYKLQWEAFNELAERDPRRYNEEFAAINRRLVPLIGNDLMRAIVGQTKDVLDPLQAMDDGEIWLMDLSLRGGKIPPINNQVLGNLIVNMFANKSYTRSPRTCRPFNLYIDEVQNYLSGDVTDILSQCRKFGLHLTMANQFLAQLSEHSELVFRGIMGTARNKICFGVDDPDDADTMAARIFAGQYDYQRVKEKLFKPAVVGTEIKNLRNESRSLGSSKSESDAESVGQGTATGWGSSTGEMDGFSSGSGVSEGMTLNLMNGHETPMALQSTGLVNQQGKSRGTSSSETSSFVTAESRSQAVAKSTSENQSTSSGVSETLAPIYKDLWTETYSLQEQKQMFRDALITQPVRTAYAVIPNLGMTKIETLDVPDIDHPPRKSERIKNKLMEDSDVHRDRLAVIEEVNERVDVMFKRGVDDDPEISGYSDLR